MTPIKRHVFHLGEPGSLAVEGHIRAAVGFEVDEARLAFAVQRRMRFPEGDCCFLQRRQPDSRAAAFQSIQPVLLSWHQAVVALLAVAEFIAAVNQRCSLACHQHENGIFQLAETQRAQPVSGSRLLRRNSRSGFRWNHPYCLAVVQIVFLFVGNAVI